MYNYVNLVGVVKNVTEQFIVNEKVTHITLAISRPFKNMNGEFEVDELDVSCYGFLGDMTQESIKIGTTIGVKGRLQPSNYTTLCKIVAERVYYIGRSEGYETDANGKEDC